MDKEKIIDSARAILKAIGEDPQREGLVKTPKRIAASYEKIFGGYYIDPSSLVTQFDGENYDEMIICKNIDFYSTCEHHMIPFFGKISIGYIPSKKIVGISKLPRMVEIFARRLQNQERLTMQISEKLNELLEPKGVGVVVEASHLCMMARGVEKQNSTMITSSCKGLFKTDQRTRAEFLKLIK
ncbi:GTP cyclohydrolase I FolE [Candidatus Peregrinibacteria bacterium]|nr:GTP cyclohydrolase I FolE [Candidatus Peregrinibacteria bacterium]